MADLVHGFVYTGISEEKQRHISSNTLVVVVRGFLRRCVSMGLGEPNEVEVPFEHVSHPSKKDHKNGWSFFNWLSYVRSNSSAGWLEC